MLSCTNLQAHSTPQSAALVALKQSFVLSNVKWRHECSRRLVLHVQHAAAAAAAAHPHESGAVLASSAASPAVGISAVQHTEHPPAAVSTQYAVTARHDADMTTTAQRAETANSPSTAASNVNSSAVVSLMQRRRQKRQQAAAQQHVEGRNSEGHSLQHGAQLQQQQKLQDTQLKPALQQLLQRMQDAHTTVELNAHSGMQQLQASSQQQLTAVAQLNQLIQSLSQPKQLLTVLLVGRGALNVVHLTTVANVLVRLAGQSQLMQQDPKYRNKVKVCYKQLRKSLEGQLLDFDPRGIASLLHCVAKLGCLDPHLRAQGLWGDLLHVSTSLMEEFEPTQLAMLAHSVAKSDAWTIAKPSRRWWNEFFEATHVAMQQQLQLHKQQQRQQRRKSSDDTSLQLPTLPTQLEQQQQQIHAQHNVHVEQRGSAVDTAEGDGSAHSQMQGASSLQDDDSTFQLQHSLVAQQPPSLQHVFTAQGFSNMVWAMGKLSRRPGADWASVLYRATEPLLSECTPQGLANLGLGLANMHVAGGLPRPGSAWIGKYLEAACGQLKGFSSQGMANVLWSLAKLGYCPSRDKLAVIFPASQGLLPKSSPQDLSLAVYSFAVLGVKPPESWWNLFWNASGRSMDQAGSQALANMFWAIGRLKKVPPTQWLLAFLPCLQQQLPHCSPQATSTVLWAAAHLKLRQLPGAWLDSVLDRVYQQLLSNEVRAQELSLYVESLQQLQHRPSSKWLERFYTASQPKLPSFSSKQLAATLAALGSLSPDQPPPQAWAAAALAAVAARIATLNAPGLCDIMWGLCELRLVPDKDTVTRYLAQTAEKMHMMNGAMLSRTLRTLVRFGYTPNADWLGLLADEAHYYLPDMTPEQLADIVWSFGRLRYNPGLTWLVTAQESGLKQLKGFGPKSLVRFLTGLAMLQVKPGVQWLGAVGYRVQIVLKEMNGQELLHSVGALERLGLGAVPVVVQMLSAGQLMTPAAAEALATASAAAAAAAVTNAGPQAIQQKGETLLHVRQQPQAAVQITGSNGVASLPAVADSIEGSNMLAVSATDAQQQEPSSNANAAKSQSLGEKQHVRTLQEQDMNKSGEGFVQAVTDGKAVDGLFKQQQPTLVLLPKPRLVRRPVHNSNMPLAASR